jgi:hypothetical protein
VLVVPGGDRGVHAPDEGVQGARLRFGPRARAGDGTHKLPVKAELRKAIGKGAGDAVLVRLEERIT